MFLAEVRKRLGKSDMLPVKRVSSLVFFLRVWRRNGKFDTRTVAQSTKIFSQQINVKRMQNDKSMLSTVPLLRVRDVNILQIKTAVFLSCFKCAVIHISPISNA